MRRRQVKVSDSVRAGRDGGLSLRRVDLFPLIVLIISPAAPLLRSVGNLNRLTCGGTLVLALERRNSDVYVVTGHHNVERWIDLQIDRALADFHRSLTREVFIPRLCDVRA